MLTGIYQILNKLNNKVYVGSSTDIKKRWRDHKWYLKNNNHHNSHLQSAWNKYGENSFEFLVLIECNIGELLIKELEFISQFNSFNNKLGYNVNDPEHKFLGKKHSKETKQKLSEQKIGNKNPMFGKCGNKHHNYDKVVSDETRNKISSSKMGCAGMKGENNPVSKLKEIDVINIRKLYGEGKLSQLKIAKLYDVSQTAINKIIARKTWSHI